MRLRNLNKILAVLIAANGQALLSHSPLAHEQVPGNSNRVLQGAQCLLNASRVKIQQTIKNQALNLREMQVFSSGNNVALNKTASQSSTYQNSQTHAASNGVDGDTENTMTHTGFGIAEWWQVDLGGSFPLENIAIRNRECGTGCLDRLSYSDLIVYDSSNTVIATKNVGDTTGVYWLNYTLNQLCPLPMLSDFENKTITSLCRVVNEEPSSALSLQCVAQDPDLIFLGTLKTNLSFGPCSAGNQSSVDGPSKTITLDTTTACKNLGYCKFVHCFRADWVYNNIAVIASMYEVDTNITFDRSGSWDATVSTDSWTASSNDVSVFNNETVQARLGLCSAISTPTRPYIIGEVVNVCVYSTNSNIELTLKNVTATPGSQTLVDNQGQPNFVTSLYYRNSSQVDLETLLIPVYYDEQSSTGNTGFITITGTADITYSGRRLNEKERELLDSAQTPFTLEIPFGNREAPEILAASQEGEVNAAYIAGMATVAWMLAAVGVLHF